MFVLIKKVFFKMGLNWGENYEIIWNKSIFIIKYIIIGSEVIIVLWEMEIKLWNYKCRNCKVVRRGWWIKNNKIYFKLY